MAQTQDDARDNMMSEIASGGAVNNGDASSKTVLIRGCDPVMAERAGKMLPPMIGNAQIVSATDDDKFFSLLEGRDFDAILFAPGACRYNASKRPIPGGNTTTSGWSLEEYRTKVRETQGGAPVVETTEEREIVPLLRAALSLENF